MTSDRAAVPSPCTKVCRIDTASGYCLGCRRTLAEIAAWSSASDHDKQIILTALPQRQIDVPT